MNSIFRTIAAGTVLGFFLPGAPPHALAQQGAATGEPLVVQTTTLPKGYLHQSYHAQLEAKGGILPLHWELSEGNLPHGIVLQSDGVLSGAPEETGEFPFTVTLSDSGRPMAQIKHPLVLTVVAPLLAKWGKYPKVNGQRLEGSILVSNQTEHDFDLTAIVMAVADNGRATAIGYQRIPVKKGTEELEIPFGDNLPKGAYQLNADVVAEVAATNSIYRARLVPNELMQVQQGP
jgi:Putative Ig domain